jgi:hypothetical protein
MIEYDNHDQIPTFLLRSSHSGWKFIEGRAPPGSFLLVGPEHGRTIPLPVIMVGLPRLCDDARRMRPWRSGRGRGMRTGHPLRKREKPRPLGEAKARSCLRKDIPVFRAKPIRIAASWFQKEKPRLLAYPI